jgi:hypothetical protein
MQKRRTNRRRTLAFPARLSTLEYMEHGTRTAMSGLTEFLGAGLLGALATTTVIAGETYSTQMLGYGDMRIFDGPAFTQLEPTVSLPAATTPGSLTVADTTPTLAASSGLTINLSKGSALLANSAASMAFDRAAAFWESQFQDPVEININANLGALGTNIIGASNPTLLIGDFDFLRDAVVADQASHRPGDITSLLPSNATASFIVPAIPGFVQYDIGGLSLTSANAKALGLGADIPPAVTVDASIVYSSQFNFDFDRSDGIAAGTIDFEGIAIHEIGHALGFVSEVDRVDSLLEALQSATLFPSVLDLFRLDASNDESTFASAPRLLIPGFDLGADGDFTQQVSFFGNGDSYLMSTGSIFGDGRQASHFKDGLNIGIMDPTFAFGELGIVSVADLRAFDVIGWDLVAVPLPAAVFLFCGALLLLFVAAQRPVRHL